MIRAHGVLAAILDHAVLDRRIVANPARAIKLPRKKQKRQAMLSSEQVEAFANNSGKYRLLVLFLSYTGLRWGEATGLRVRDFNPLRSRVQVTENAVAVGGKIVVDTPKSHKARSVPVPRSLTAQLAELTEGKLPEQILFGDGDSYVRFPDTRTGWFVRALRLSQAADPTFPTITRHDLRHTAASLAIAVGANPKVVQRMIGHASAAMTLDTYAHLFEDDLDAVADAIDRRRNESIVVTSLSRQSEAN